MANSSSLTGTYRPRSKTAFGSGVMQQKLTEAGFSRPRQRQNNVSRIPRLPAVITRQKDGSDHINIWLKAATDLGIGLNHMEKCPVNHPLFKSFNSIEGMWHWLRDVNHDDRHRNSFGISAKINAKNDETMLVPNFKHFICEANWIKVKTNEWFVNEMKESTLPFDMYYYDRGDNNQPGVAVRPPSAVWLVACFEEIRKAVKEDREPDFSFLGPKQDFNISDFIKVAPAHMPKKKENKEPRYPRGQTPGIVHVDDSALQTHTAVAVTLNEKDPDQQDAIDTVNETSTEQSQPEFLQAVGTKDNQEQSPADNTDVTVDETQQPQ